MGNSAVTGKINLGAISPIVRKIPPSNAEVFLLIKGAFSGRVLKRLNQVKTGELNAEIHRSPNSRVGGLI